MQEYTIRYSDFDADRPLNKAVTVTSNTDLERNHFAAKDAVVEATGREKIAIQTVN